MASTHVIGIDIGGSKIECALVAIKKNLPSWLHQTPTACEEIFAIISRERVATERERGYAQIVTKIARLIEQACTRQQIALTSLHGIGIGMPGAVNTAMLMVNGNTLALIDKDIRADLCAELGFQGKCVCENDASCFALAEAMGSIGIDFHHQHGVPLAEQLVVGLILGTGLGAGFFCRGSIYRGKDSSALELGHRVFVRDGKMCYCGRRGCVEQYLSGSALEASFNLHRPANMQGKLDAAKIFALAAQKDPAAVATINQYRRDLAQLLIDVSNVFDPHYIVLGGGLSNQDSIYQTLAEDMQAELFAKQNPPQIKKNQLGDSSGVLGAALLPLLDS